MRKASLVLAALAAVALASCKDPRIPVDDYVYLRMQHQAGHSSCSSRFSFQRIGPDGLVTGPQDANGNFVIPAGRSFVLTDIHAFYDLDTAAPAARQQTISIYIQAPSRGSETDVWFPTINAAPGERGVYDRALTTGIRVSAGNMVCTATRDQTNPTHVVLTGYLQ